MCDHEQHHGGANQDTLIELAHAKIREQDEEIERLKRQYTNLKMEIIEIRGQLAPPRRTP